MLKNQEKEAEASLWKDYELIDCGDYEKLERFGKYVLIRPEPQAIWPRVMPVSEWKRLAHAHFIREKQVSSYRTGSSENGGWQFYKEMPQRWEIQFQNGGLRFSFRCVLTSFGHIGVFPEQASNWIEIDQLLREHCPPKPKVLNLFAYTGGASLAARNAGADVTHLDAVKQVVNWASENMQLSGMDGIRWVVEDAMLYIQREVKRGKKYNAIILDPPSFGRGPKGEKWLLADMLADLIRQCKLLLEPSKSFVVLNLYSMGYSPVLAKNLLMRNFPDSRIETKETCLTSTTGLSLPLGITGIATI